MQVKTGKIGANFGTQLKATGDAPHTVKKVCVTPHTRPEKRIQKARVGFEESKELGKALRKIILKLTNILERKTIEVQTHTGENTSQEVLIICNLLISN